MGAALYRGVRKLRRYGRGRERRLHVTLLVLFTEDHVGVAVEGGESAVERVLDPRDRRERFVVDRHRLGRVLGEVGGGGHHRRYRLADEAGPLARQHRTPHSHGAGPRELRHQPAHAAQILGTEGELDARRARGGREVDAAHPRMRVLAAREREMQHAFRAQVVDEPRAALEQRTVLHPRNAPPDLARQVLRRGPVLTSFSASFGN